MSKPCSICRHKKRAEIDKALVVRETFRGVAAKYGVSKSALVRHSDDHLPASLIRAREAREAADADALLAQMLDLRDEALGILQLAKEAEELGTALNAIKTTQGCVELLGKLAGQLRDAPTINLVLSPEWQVVQANILGALDSYPEARLAVAHALGDSGVAGHA